MVKRFEKFLTELGEMEYSRMKQFWVTPRMVNTIEDTFGVSFFEISKEDMADEIPKIFIYGGSTMPFDKGTRLQQYIQLAQTQAEDGKPMVDREALLDAMEIKDRFKIIARMTPEPEPMPAPVPMPMPQDMQGGMPMPMPMPMPSMGGAGGVPIAGAEQDQPMTPEEQAMLEMGLDPNDPNVVALLQQNS
jgi:hypothetical protein